MLDAARSDASNEEMLEPGLLSGANRALHTKSGVW
jgi:hypothetical protein